MLEKLSKRLVPYGRAHPRLRWPILGLLMLAWSLDGAWAFIRALGRELRKVGQEAAAHLRETGLTPQGIHDNAERLLDAGIRGAKKLPGLWKQGRQVLLPLVYTKGRAVWNTARQWCLAQIRAVKVAAPVYYARAKAFVRRTFYGVAGVARRGADKLRADLPQYRRHAPRRAMAAALALVLCLGMLPVSAFASEWQSACPHDLGQHDETCGYIAAVEGTPCAHTEHTDCGYVEAVPETPCTCGVVADADGNTVHQDGCGYIPATEGTACKHAQGEHDEPCGYAEAVASSPCIHRHDENCGGLPAPEPAPEEAACTCGGVADEDGNIVHLDGCAYEDEPSQAPIALQTLGTASNVIVEGTTIYAGGTPLVIAGTGDASTTIFIDANGDGKADGDQSLQTAGVASAPADNIDLSGYTVYGGSKNTALTGNTNITMTGGKVDNIYGGSPSSTTTGNTAVTVTGGTVSDSVYGGGLNGSVDGDTAVAISGTAVVNSKVFGGGRGGAVGNTAVTIGDTAVVSDRVYGGSYSGSVSGSATVTLNSGTVGSICGGGEQSASTAGSTAIHINDGSVGNVYGGGYFGSVTGNTAITMTTGTVKYDIYGGGSSGSVGGSTAIDINGGEVTGNVYGGGSSGSSVTGSTSVTITAGEVAKSVYGGGSRGNVGGSTSVTLTGGKVWVNVYGGGYQGSVTGSTAVTVGASAKIGFNVYGIVINGTGVTNGVTSFNIAPSLTADAAVQVCLPAGYATGTIATNVVAGDVAKIKLVGSGASNGATYLDGTEIKVKETTPVTGVSLNKTSATLTVGGEETLIATVAPANATNQTVAWNSLDDEVATVDDAGKVTAKAVGTAIITVTTADGGKTADCEVTVSEPATTPTEKTATPVFDEGHDVRRSNSKEGPAVVYFYPEYDYPEGTTFQLYTAETGDTQPVGITATYDYVGFIISGITQRIELWVSATEEGKTESGRTKITALLNFDGAVGTMGSSVYLKTPQDLAVYLNYCQPNSATLSGDTVTMSCDAMVLHNLSFGQNSYAEPPVPEECFPYGGTLDLNGHTLSSGPSVHNYVNLCLGRLTLRGGTLSDIVSADAGTSLFLENCLLQSTSQGLLSAGNVELTDTTIKIVDVGQFGDPDDAKYRAYTYAVRMVEDGALTIHTGALENAFSEGCTYVGTQALADCIADGSVSTPADSSIYDGDSEDFEGMQACRETVTVTVFDPDAYRPINGGVTVTPNKDICANGNPITLMQGKDENHTKIYYTNDPKRAIIPLKGMTGNTTDGYDLTGSAVRGGSHQQDVASTAITMTGGTVEYLFGGGWGCNVSGAAAITMTGGTVVDTLTAGSTSDGSDDTVYTVATAVVKVTGGTAEYLTGSGGNNEYTPIGVCDITVAGDASVGMLSFENTTSPSLTVGGNAKVGMLALNTETAPYGVDSFAIDPDLGADASIGLFMFDPLKTGRVIATGAVAGDVDKISLSPYGEAYVGPHRVYLDGTSIKCEPLPTYGVSGMVTDGTGNVSGAVVNLMRGRTQIGESVTTESDGAYSFEKVPAGAYNLVATNDGKTVTRLVSVTNADLTDQNLTMPTENKNSVIEVKDDAPAVVVGGLDAIAAGTELSGADSVTIKFTVEAKEESAADGAASIKALAGNKTVGDFLDLTLSKVVLGTGAGITPITDTGTNILEIVVPYDFTGKKDVTVYRHHGEAEKLIVLNARPAESAMADKTFFADETGGFLHIYTAKFSTYAVAYTPASGSIDPPIDPPVDPPASSGGSGGVTTYAITATAGTGGSVSPAGRTYVDHNGKKTFTIAPDAGYEIADVLVDGKSVMGAVTLSGGVGTYTFEKVTAKHTLEASFQKISSLPFTDVAEGDWFYESVKYVYEKGLMSGTSDTAFSPYLTTSRSMIVTILWRLEGEPEAKGANPFADVSTDKYYANAIAWAAENGIVKGYGNGNVGPNDPITREQLASILYRYTQFKGQDVTAAGDLSKFTDQPSAWAMDAMQWAVGAGVMNGKGNHILDPKGDATLAQVAVMLTQYLNK